MKKIILPALLIAGLFASCSEKSKKGAWIAADKDNYISECKKAANGEKIEEMDDATFQKFVDGVCDCTFKKLEAQYENPVEADKDLAGVTKIGEECGMEVAMSLMGDMLKNMGEETAEEVVTDTTAAEAPVVE